jgi:hypothetical protein
MKLIKKSLPKWLKNTSMDPDCPHNFPEPEITTSGNNNSREDSSQGDVSYLSSSAGSYDLLMENECDNVFNEAPSQRSRNSMSVSGFSWAKVTARNPQTPSSQGTRSNVSKITTPTAVQIDELEKLVAALANQVKDMTMLLNHQSPSGYQPQKAYGFQQGSQNVYDHQRCNNNRCNNSTWHSNNGTKHTGYQPKQRHHATTVK